MTLLRLTNAIDGTPLYVNPLQVCSLFTLEPAPLGPDGSPLNNSYSYNHNYHRYMPEGIDSGTGIVLTKEITVYVKEHIAEVVAILEGRDAYPAKVLFGDKDERTNNKTIKGNRG